MARKKKSIWEFLKELPEGASVDDFTTITVETGDGELAVIGYIPIKRVNATTRRGDLSSIRADVWDKTNGHCWHCGRELHPFRDFHIDHLVPFSQGGSDELENLVPSCDACNLSKGGKSLDEWRS